MKRQTVEIEDLSALERFAQSLATEFSGRRALLLLDGEMGAGKTQFTRFLVSALGGEETQSPSFAIHNRYETPQGAIEHFDLFRLETSEDLESTGFWDLFRAAKAIVVIEWAERLADFGVVEQLPRSWPQMQIHFEGISENARRLRISRKGV